ncbi:baseplate J/gp47 family protein [Nocardioides gilvus]|uniref:baseplate J/gp47 family protein n=1 Tax=Nocardioides gilvus TaxID=1735589 RepID=UPI000D74AB7E|nr:baseplate J/gp47 family protein [Nocardioides gilvus]
MSLEMPSIDDLDYETLMAEAKARIAVHNPDWNNWNDADPGITLLQLFAFMTDSLLYRANLVPERNRRAFLRLLGLRQRSPVPAEGLVAFDATKGPLAAHVVPGRAEVRAGNVPFLTDRAIDVLPVSALACAKVPSTAELGDSARSAYLSMYADLDPDADDVQLYDTRRLDVPAGGARYRPIRIAESVDRSLWVALLAPRPTLVQAVRDLIGGKVLSIGIVPDVVDASRVMAPASVLRASPAPRLVVTTPAPGPLPVDPEPRIPTYRELDTSEHGDVLVEPGVLDVTLPPPDELVLWDDLEGSEEGFGDFPPPLEPGERARVVTWLRITRALPSSGPGGALGASFSWLGVNATTMRQIGRVAEERLPDGTGESDQRVHLGQRSVLAESVRIRVDGVEWQRVDDLRSAPAETHAGTVADRSPHVFFCDSDGTVRFGDGLRGARPPRGARIRAEYAWSEGAAGVLPAGGVRTALGLPPGLQVTNPVATWGGQDAESIEDAEARMSEEIHHRDRLVTRQDMLEIVRRTPGVDLGRVEILPLLHPLLVGVESPGVVTVMVIPRFDPAQPDAPRPDQMFLDQVCSHLEPRRLVTTELHVLGPQYVEIVLSIGFDPAPGRDVPDVRERIKARVRALLSPVDTVADDDLGAWPLAKAVDPLEILTVVARVDGVARINGVRLTGPDGVTVVGSLPLGGLQLPRLVGLAVQPGDAPTIATGADSAPPTTRLLPVPAIPEEC